MGDQVSILVKEYPTRPSRLHLGETVHRVLGTTVSSTIDPVAERYLIPAEGEKLQKEQHLPCVSRFPLLFCEKVGE